MFGRGCFGGYGFTGNGPVNSGFTYLVIGLRIFIVLAVLLLILSLFKHIIKSSNDAARILDERYAKGDIGEEEYFSKKSNIAKK
ncbi:MAG: SHOCT domain-containing protein [Bacillota bacterium]|nr:SHOCT domain-containing protein [Bacillota bacterium]